MITEAFEATRFLRCVTMTEPRQHESGGSGSHTSEAPGRNRFPEIALPAGFTYRPVAPTALCLTSAGRLQGPWPDCLHQRRQRVGACTNALALGGSSTNASLRCVGSSTTHASHNRSGTTESLAPTPPRMSPISDTQERLLRSAATRSAACTPRQAAVWLFRTCPSQAGVSARGVATAVV